MTPPGQSELWRRAERRALPRWRAGFSGFPPVTGAGVMVAAVCLFAACSTTGLQPAGDHLALGTWGGPNAGVIVTDSLTHIHIGCTFGDIAERVALDSAGRFTVDGSYVLRAYPIMIGPPLPAQFTGQVLGSTLTLTATVNDTVEMKVVKLGPVAVTYGRDPELGPCPICRVPGTR